MSALAIEAVGLTRRFGERLAVDALDLEVPRGSVLGFLGPNGAGKTTTVRMLAALIAPSAGGARVCGLDVERDPDAVRAKVGVLTETPGLYDRLSALENVVLHARLHGLSRRDARARAETYLGRVGLAERATEAAGGFSKGMRQRLALARALVHEPELVFLDEPTSGLDPEAARSVRALVRELAARGATVVLATHNLPEAEALSDRVAVFDTRLRALGTARELCARLPGHGTRLSLGEGADLSVARAIAERFGPTRVEDRALSLELAEPERTNPALLAALAEGGVPVAWVEPRSATLEDVYLSLVGRARAEGS